MPWPKPSAWPTGSQGRGIAEGGRYLSTCWDRGDGKTISDAV
jgi:hypothetical protein